MSLREDLQKKLLELSRKTLENKLCGKSFDLSEYDLVEFQEKRGIFVTLTKNAKLRGCMGRISPDFSIFEGTKKISLTAALEDPRFPSLTEKELDFVKIEISLLTVPEKIQGKSALEKIEKVNAGVDGIIISSAFHSATFLPQVWEQLPRKEDFFSHLCTKARLRADFWKTEDLDIESYQVEHFEEV